MTRLCNTYLDGWCLSGLLDSLWYMGASANNRQIVDEPRTQGLSLLFGHVTILIQKCIGTI